MSGRNNSHNSDRHSIKYKRNQPRGPSFEAEHSCVNYKHSLSKNEANQCHKNPDLKSPEILSLSQFSSTIGHIWDSASQSLSCVCSKETVNQHDIYFRKIKVLIDHDERKNERAFGKTTFPWVSRSTCLQPRTTRTRRTQRSFVIIISYVVFEKNMKS